MENAGGVGWESFFSFRGKSQLERKKLTEVEIGRFETNFKILFLFTLVNRIIKKNKKAKKRQKEKKGQNRRQNTKMTLKDNKRQND